MKFKAYSFAVLLFRVVQVLFPFPLGNFFRSVFNRRTGYAGTGDTAVFFWCMPAGTGFFCQIRKVYIVFANLEAESVVCA